MAATTFNPDDTPRRQCLKRGIRKLSNEIQLKNKRLKVLQQTVRRQNKKIASLREIVTQLKKENLINDDANDMLLQSFGKHNNLITNWSKKNLGKKVPKKYTPEVRQFALSLHFFSAKAYDYVRKQFNTILPHSRTLGKWYSHVNAEPGFTDEALKTLKLKVQNSSQPTYCSLTFDEMSIRQHLESDGVKYYGRVDFGNGLNTDDLEMAKECLVFMLVSLNENWKLPIGYFLSAGLNSSQKVTLTQHALNIVRNTGVIVTSITFDGCSTNLTMARLLGCNFNLNSFKSTFITNYSDNEIGEVAVFLDPAHMIKLIRNAFGEKKQFLDGYNKVIDFDFVLKLFLLQEREGSHLANKLSKQHIFFFKQKMKVKLATQLLSQSVADALKFCKNNLQLKEFSESDPTIQFIEMFNKGFDILNSRSINSIGNKKALCKNNIKNISEFANNFINYIQCLKIKEINKFVPVLESSRKTGFLGFVMCFSSLSHLYNTLIETKKLTSLKLYKISQDHLELFFGNIRSLGGHNNNPTARQFQSAYKKLVIRINDVQSFNTGNCISLEHIDILHYSSADPIKTINSSSSNPNSDIIVSEEIKNDVNEFINDHDYICAQNPYTFSNFSKEIIIYIAGFVVHKLTSTLHCDICVKSLYSVDKAPFLNSLITLKNKGGNKGGLAYPSDDVILICLHTEKILKNENYHNKAINHLQVQTKVLNHFLYNPRLFSTLKSHSVDSTSPLSDHVYLLIKSIAFSYIKLKVNYSLKQHREKPSLRMWYNKLTLFKGQ